MRQRSIPRATIHSILESVQGRSFNGHCPDCPAELLALTSLLTQDLNVLACAFFT